MAQKDKSTPIMNGDKGSVDTSAQEKPAYLAGFLARFLAFFLGFRGSGGISNMRLSTSSGSGNLSGLSRFWDMYCHSQNGYAGFSLLIS